MKIAVLGPKGTFSDKAYAEYERCYQSRQRYEEGAEASDTGLEAVYCPTIDEVFEMVCTGDDSAGEVCELGIVPIENTLDGYVQRTLDLLLERDVRIIGENTVPVQFSLVANASCQEEIEKLYVQFKANGQCRQFISSMKDVKIITTESNMESYYRIAEEQGAAAVVPKHIAEEEKNRFVLDNVTDADNNHTRFVVFTGGSPDWNAFKTICGETSVSGGKNGEASEENLMHGGKVRIPVYIMPAVDRPGILYSILRSFYENQINLISIMSRPTKQELGTYNFYIEIEGLKDRMDVIFDTLSRIRVYNDIKILGIYNE